MYTFLDHFLLLEQEICDAGHLTLPSKTLSAANIDATCLIC